MTDSPKTYQIHIHISGEDRPGILAETLECVVQCESLEVDIKEFMFDSVLAGGGNTDPDNRFAAHSACEFSFRTGEAGAGPPPR